jgi:broad specificity phosphatase PhoE
VTAQVRRRIYLMRHGAVTYFGDDGKPLPPDDVPLNDTGVIQAQAAGALFAAHNVAFDRVIVSGLPRTVATATHVLAALPPHIHRPKVEHRAQLSEIQSGKLSAIPAAELAASFTEVMQGTASLDARFLGGEKLGDMLARVLPEIDELRADSNWQNLLMVLHGGVNRGILSYLLSGEARLLGGFEQSPACINVIDVGTTQRDVVIRAVNLSPTDWLQPNTRTTTMETLFGQYAKYRQLAATA